MINFIELTLAGNSKILLNVANITHVETCRKAIGEKYGYSSTVTMTNQQETDHHCVKEAYDKIVEKINRCTAAIVIK